MSSGGRPSAQISVCRVASSSLALGGFFGRAVRRWVMASRCASVHRHLASYRPGQFGRSFSFPCRLIQQVLVGLSLWVIARSMRGVRLGVRRDLDVQRQSSAAESFP